ncbi:hypothetical protein E3U55_16175 [Filobacillus milosensis]|uniref:Uncharacterized protein n=1 Tax=Filobacillus milosensis TaxID=94137 RepID=A0A4Y8IBM9_9BACI|nr:hypothetical protein [Filobacillus milosensis]TFB13377.1 hypothetical protein E3U55_16175 [Filobacillus milosensis]
MRHAILQMFWGLMIVFFDFRFNSFDILMDPLGYIILAVGLGHFATLYKPAKTGQIISIILIVMSIPEVFIDTNVQPFMLGFWHFYFLAVSILSIVLTYFIFLLLIDLADAYNNQELKVRSEKTMKAYLIIMIAVMFFSTFSINFRSLVALFIILAIVGFIAHIVFLVLLFKFRNLEDNNDENEPTLNHENSTEG